MKGGGVFERIFMIDSPLHTGKITISAIFAFNEIVNADVYYIIKIDSGSIIGIIAAVMT